MKVPIWRRRNLAGILVILLASTYLLAQNSQPAPEVQSTPVANAEELRKKALNPVADLISVPIQENRNFGIQPGDRTQNVLHPARDPSRPVKKLEFDHSLDYTRRLSTSDRSAALRF